MESSSLEKEKIIKGIRNLLRLKKERNHTAIKDIRHLFRLEKAPKAIKYRILRDIRNLLSMKKKKIIINQ